MKTTTTIAAILSVFLVSAGTAEAQEWGGVAGIAAARGYSASSGFGMLARPQHETPIVAGDDAPQVATPIPRPGVPRTGPMKVAETVPRARHAHRTRFAMPRASMLAKAKRPGARRRARVA